MAHLRSSHVHTVLAAVMLLSMLVLGVGTLALGVLMVLWPMGVSPSAYESLWWWVLVTCVWGCGGMLIPFALSRLLVFAGVPER